MTPGAQLLLADELDDVLEHLRAFRFDASTEDTFQLAVARALQLRGAAFEREVRLSARDRIDFLLGGGIGLELKINGAPSEVTRQLLRYAESDRISALVLVTTRALHRAMPAVLLGKPLRVHWQGGIG
jgi:hypothetical protein